MTDSLCKLLLIDPNPSDAELADKLLVSSLSDCELIVISDAIAFAEQLATGGFSVVISEQALGWASGVDVLTTFSRRYPYTATLLFSETLPAQAQRPLLGSRLFSSLQKNSAGFLQLPDMVHSLLKARREIRGADEFWRQLLKQLDTPALATTVDGRVVDANAAATVALGFTYADELQGLALDALFELDADGSLQQQLQTMMKDSVNTLDIEESVKVKRSENRGRLSIHALPGNTHLAVLYQAQAAAPFTGSPGGDQQQYQQLLYAVSHDLQEPLQLVSRYTDLLQEDCKAALGDNGGFLIDNLVSNAKLMQSMLDDLLEYSRLDRLQPNIVAVDLNEVVDDVHALYAHRLQELGGKIRKSDLPTVQADRGQMVRLFQNLIGNAIKFHGKKKPVITIHAVQKDGSWEVMVEDNGIGIDSNQFRSVFTMFKRLHSQESIPGNGMGLALCERIVKAHGGRIWAQAREDRKGGVVFHFTLKATGTGRDGNQSGHAMGDHT